MLTRSARRPASRLRSTSATVVLLLETEVEKPFVVPFVPDTPLTPLNAIPEPPPAAMAAALKIAAVFLLSNKT